MKKAVIFILCIITAMLVFVPPAQACTAFSAADENAALFGNNEDGYEKDTFIWFVPGTQGKFGMTCVGVENAHPQGGLNEAGLAMDWVMYKYYSPENYAPVLDTKMNYPGDINAGLLETCATVDEAISFYQKYNDFNLGYALLYVADRNGKSAVITWDEQKNDISVTTATYGFNAVGYGKKPADKLFEQNNTITADTFRELARAARQPGLTRYSNIFDLKTCDITLYCERNYDEAVRFNLHDELKKGLHMIEIPALFGRTAVGEDIMNPETVLPLYLRIIIYAVGIFMILNIGFMVLSLIRCKSPNPLKITVRFLGIAASVIALYLLYLIYYRFCFIFSYGFGMLGMFTVILAWAFAAAALAQFILCLIAVIRRSFNKGAAIIYIISSFITMAAAVELFISGFMK